MTLGDAVSGLIGPHQVPPPSPATAGGAEERMRALLALLDEERSMLERLVHKLAAATVLAEAAEDVYLLRAADEVVEAEEDLGAMELARAMMVADICDLLGFANELTLTQLTQVAPEGLREPLERRRSELLAQVDDVNRLRERGRGAVEERLARIEQGLSGLEAAMEDGRYEPPSSRRFT